MIIKQFLRFNGLAEGLIEILIIVLIFWDSPGSRDSIFLHVVRHHFGFFRLIRLAWVATMMMMTTTITMTMNYFLGWNVGYNIYRCRWPIWIWRLFGCLKTRPSLCSRSRLISTIKQANRSSLVSYCLNWSILTSHKVRYP